jgi:putative peptide zinc metalloprotease protein
MSGPLLSTLWYRVADLKPKLRSHAKLHRHQYRGEIWHLLRDPASGRVSRFSPESRSIISLMDGEHAVIEIWQIANRQLGENAPTQDEIIELLGQLHASDLLQSDVAPDVAELFTRGAQNQRARYKRSFGNPMAVRIPLWDPDAFLNRFPGLIGLIWSRWGAALWCAVVLPAAILILPHWPELTNNFSDRVLAVDNLLVLYLVFPLLKLFHELGHATATKARGGEVHDLGLVLLALLPVPYVEASAATTFRSKYLRALVGAGGVMFELFLAALAFYLWLAIEPGTVRAILYNVMVIAGVSTLLFNGNPLMRYDAYYVLADLTEIPNLASRSLQYWSYCLERYLLGARDRQAPPGGRGEKMWMLVYGLTSTLYRIFVTVLIALFIASRFFFVGVLLAGWAVAVMAVMPVVRMVRHLVSSPRLHANRSRAVGVSVGLAAAVLGFLLFVPTPYHTFAQGVVWLPEESLVRAHSKGFLVEFLAQPGTIVAKGDPLVRCTDPQLVSDMGIAEAKVAQWTAIYKNQLVTDRLKAQITRDTLVAERANLALTQQRVRDLTMRAQIGGTFLVPQMGDQEGRFLREGDLLGYVIGSALPIARVVVPQDAIDRVRAAADEAEVKLIDQPGTTLTGHVIRAVPSADEMLPSKALAVDGGGDIATDPREQRGPKAMQRMFQFDVQLDTDPHFTQFGQRVYVRFAHESEPLFVQWFRGVRLLFLSRFSV